MQRFVGRGSLSFLPYLGTIISERGGPAIPENIGGAGSSMEKRGRHLPVWGFRRKEGVIMAVE